MTASDKRCIFISRAGEDALAAQRIAAFLQEAGYEFFLQEQDLPGSGSFPHEINEALQRATQFIAVLSPDYIRKDYCLHELYEAWRRDPVNRNRTLILAKVRDCQAPDLVGQFVYLNLFYLDDKRARSAVINALEGHWQAGSAFTRRLSIGKLPATDPTLIGRDKELARLEAAWADPKTNFLQIIAPGGTGKTALMTKWYKRHLDEATVFGWSFYSQGSSVDRNTSSDPFFAEVLRFFDIKVEATASIYTKAEVLASRLREERVLLILDGMEPLQESTGGLKDTALKVLLEELTVRNLGMVLCTTRVRITDVPDDVPSAVSIELDNLEPADGAKYLRHLKVNGTDEELEQASCDFGNHALALTLMGTYVTDFLSGDIRRRGEILDLFDPDTRYGEHARRVMQGYEKMFAGKPEAAILRALGYFDRPAEPQALRLVVPEMTPVRYQAALNRLADARLILTREPRQPIDCHPLVRERFGAVAKREDRKAYEDGHSLLYEYYCKQAPFRPNTLEEMTPLFNAVRHCCQAGRYQEAFVEVYDSRIMRGDESYLVRQLGAFDTNLSLLAHFFEMPWSRPVTTLSACDRSRIVSEGAFALRAVGRLADAVEPMQSAAASAAAEEDWLNAAIRFSYVGEIQLTLGRVDDAIATARESVRYADKSGDSNQYVSSRTSLAAALHQAGHVLEAIGLFQAAERAKAGSQSEHPLLDGVGGYRYCDVLVSRGQSAEVLRHARQTLLRHEKLEWLHFIGLDHISLGRAYPRGSPESAEHLNQAVEFLRRAGMIDYRPLALLARGTDADLAEVFRIATRSGMRLHLTDYHMAMARRHSSKDHFDKAAQLIADTGYHRRDAELEELRQLPLR